MKTVQKSGLNTDVAFSQLLTCKENASYCIKLSREVGVKVGMGECLQQKFKFLLDIDGNAYSRRFPTLGSTTSCILRFGIYSTWYHEFLKPGIHYVYMSHSAERNVTLFRDSIPTDEEARKMAVRMAVASRKVMTDGAKCYWLRLLFYYADTFGFKLRNHV